MALVNKGVFPVDPATPVGLARTSIGDVNSVPLEPAEDGVASYDYFSDVEIAGFLILGSMSPLRATGYALRQLAVGLTMQERSTATDDLRLDTKNRGKNLFEIAQSYFDEADAIDGAEGYFTVVPYCPAPSRGY